MTTAEMLKKFQEKFVTGGVTNELRKIRRELLTEEFTEYLVAEKMRDVVQIADSLADIVYVAYGTALCYGIDLDACIAEVHGSNMTKDLPEKEGGKAVKGPSYSPPDIERVMNA
jgi:hypothetical protein